MVRLMCLLLCLMILPHAACAQAETARLTLRLREDGQGLSGASFALYRVARLTENARFELLSGYDAGDADVNSLSTAQAWSDLAATLAAQVGEPYAEAATNQAGEAIFTQMETGLYLVVGQKVEIGSYVYEFAPFMVALPGLDGDEWNYDVLCDVKHTRTAQMCDIQIVKVWNDAGYTKLRPMRILVDLYCDGEVAGTVELSAENNWSYTFADLESAHEWTVREQTVPSGYAASYAEQNGAWVITNTLVASPTTAPDIPQTGLTWWPVPVMGLLGAALFIIGWAMRRKWRNEHDQA